MDTEKNTQNSPVEIGNRPEFRQFIQEGIDRLRHKRNIAVVEPGYRLKRHAFDRLEDKGMMTAEAFAAEFQRIVNKESRLSAAERALISAIVMAAAERVVLAIRTDEEKQKAAEKGQKKPRVARKSKGGIMIPPEEKEALCEKSGGNNGENPDAAAQEGGNDERADK